MSMPPTEDPLADGPEPDVTTAPPDGVEPESGATDVVDPDRVAREDIDPDRVAREDVDPDRVATEDVDPDHAATDHEGPESIEPGDVQQADVEAGAEGRAGAVEAGAPSVGPPRGPWHALGHALRPRVTRAQVLTGLLCGLLGFAVVAQVRQTHVTGLSTLRQSELVGILDQTTRQADDLQAEARQLERTRQELESGSTSRQAAVDTATRSAATQGILTGRLPAEGPGIVVTLTEPEGTIRALTLLNVLEELRNAGAEAVQLNDLRLTASSYFVTSTDGVVVDGTTLSAPYTWLAIGEPDVMPTALDMPGGALASVRNDGGRGVVSTRNLVQISATRSLEAPVYATPVPATED